MNTTEYGPETVAASGTSFARNHRRIRLLSLIAIWTRRWEQRGALATLDAHLLRDIGKTRNQALSEAAKPFWRP